MIIPGGPTKDAMVAFLRTLGYRVVESPSIFKLAELTDIDNAILLTFDKMSEAHAARFAELQSEINALKKRCGALEAKLAEKGEKFPNVIDVELVEEDGTPRT